MQAADHCTVLHLVSGPRLPFTAAYFGSIALTLYSSVSVGHGSLPALPLSMDPARIVVAPSSLPPLPHASLSIGCLLTLGHLTTASHAASDPRCNGRAAGLSRLLYGFVLSHGFHRPAVCCSLWRQPSRGLDERMSPQPGGGLLESMYTICLERTRRRASRRSICSKHTFQVGGAKHGNHCCCTKIPPLYATHCAPSYIRSRSALHHLPFAPASCFLTSSTVGCS